VTHKRLAAQDATAQEMSDLVETLHRTEQRLEELTAGEIDAVVDHSGRSYLLRRAQDEMRVNEAARQAAVLDALPAYIALLDAQGNIVSTNHAWRNSPSMTVQHAPGAQLGSNYLVLCQDARGAGCSQSFQIAAGTRDVLTGSAKSFSFKYSCQSMVGQRWLLMMVTPLGGDAPSGAVVMHLDITKEWQGEINLIASERRFSDMLRNVDLATVMLDCDARITFCNQCLLGLTDWKNEEVVGRNWFDTFVPSADATSRDAYRERLKVATDGWQIESAIVTRSGESRLMRWHNSVLRSGTGAVIGSASIGEDITEQRRSEIRIKHLNRVYAVLSGINTLIVHAKDREELYREACRIAVEDGGFRMSMISIVDRQTSRVVPAASAGKDEELFASIANILASPEGAPSTLIVKAIQAKAPLVVNDSLMDARVLFSDKYSAAGVRSLAVFPLIVAGEAVGALSLFSSELEFFHADELKLLAELTDDISHAIDHIGKQERLDYLAFYDVLTGLANRALFCERLELSLLEASRGDGRLAVMLLDIERFRNVNDTYGREAGDRLLAELAARLAASEVDVMRLARIDADHFAIMVLDSPAEAEVVSRIDKRMVEIFTAPFHIAGTELRVSAKVGIAVSPDDGTEADVLLRNADTALKNAKARGARYLFYTQKMNERVVEKLSLENRLRQAIELEQFVLHYQPKISFATGKLTGCEALIRWNDPQSGLVPPGQFIPILEETGLILEVGRWALRKALEDYLRWRAAGLPATRIAVNVSPLQLRHRGFADEIQAIFGAHALAPEALELEVTEGMIMEVGKDSIATLQGIRALGVSIAMDDFGTGFSSLSYLARLPVDTLKIDRSFVVEMTAAPVGLALVSTIITLAHSLKLKVVAEGVETEEQCRLLRLLSCDEMQGFLLSKAVPSEEFETKFLKAGALDFKLP
jgi:diguanylate cyclase (GGDEF)-like protein/PAS domain S-box-containing protein